MSVIFIFVVTYLTFFLIRQSESRLNQMRFGQGSKLFQRSSWLYGVPTNAFFLLCSSTVVALEGWAFGIIVWGTVICLKATCVIFSLPVRVPIDNFTSIPQ